MKLTLHNLRPARGSVRERKRLGRGHGSGKGKTSGRGQKGQKARSGWKGGTRPGFEGGQTPLYMRFPKRGFTNTCFRVDYSIVNVGRIAECFRAGDVVDIDAMKKAGIVKGRKPVKVLGDGDIDISVTVKAHKFSASAKRKIEQAGGRCEEIS